MYETSEVEIRVQVLWDGGLAAGGRGSMDICKEIFGFEKLGSLQWCLVCKGRKKAEVNGDRRGLLVESLALTGIDEFGDWTVGLIHHLRPRQKMRCWIGQHGIDI